MATRGRRSALRRWVAATLAGDDVLEATVVVDGDVDGSMGELEALAAEHPRLHPLLSSGRGQFHALQLGVEQSRGDIVLLLDDDVIIAPSTAAGHARVHEAGVGRVVLGYMPVSLPPSRRRGQAPTWLYATDYEWQCDQYTKDPSQVLQHLWAGNVSLRRDDCLRVGLQGAPNGRHADRDFGLRCKAAGLEGVFDPTLRAQHLFARTFDQYLRDADAGARGNWTLHRAHPGLGPLGRRELTAHIPTPAATAVVVGAGRLNRPVVWTLCRVADFGGLVRWWKLESVAAMTASHTIQFHVIRQLDREREATPIHR
jgi:glycosyltransferase involved in cell wall biosynthesis